MTLQGMDQGDDESTPLTDSGKPAAIATATSHAAPADRKYLLERVDDAAVVQLYADGFSALPLEQKILIWHLYQAALAGRDIYFDQRYRYALEMREVLEETLPAARQGAALHTEAATIEEIRRYTKLFWINGG